MATSTAPTPINTRRDMQEVDAPKMFQFSGAKPAIEGVLLNINKVAVKGKETIQYMIQDIDGNRFTFLATYDLLRKIQPAHVGHWIYVMFEGEDLEIKTQGSPMRKFRVAVSKDLEPAFKNAHGVAASDDDIPF